MKQLGSGAVTGVAAPVPLATVLRPARLAAFGPGEYVGQESFMRATDIRELAARAGIAAGTTVLDLCCGLGGPGRLVAAGSGCTYLGVDACQESVATARRLGGRNCRYEVMTVPPLPPDRFDVVLLLETMLAFRDKASLVAAVASALVDRGRFAFTVEDGDPLTDAERGLMPDPDTVWPVPLPELVGRLGAVGLRVTWQKDCTRAHQLAVDALLAEFGARSGEVVDGGHGRELDELMTGHRWWSRWLREGRVRKFAVVAELESSP